MRSAPRARQACEACAQSKCRCSGDRPCARCARRGWGDQCVDRKMPERRPRPARRRVPPLIRPCVPCSKAKVSCVRDALRLCDRCRRMGTSSLCVQPQERPSHATRAPTEPPAAPAAVLVRARAEPEPAPALVIPSPIRFVDPQRQPPPRMPTIPFVTKSGPVVLHSDLHHPSRIRIAGWPGPCDAVRPLRLLPPGQGDDLIARHLCARL